MVWFIRNVLPKLHLPTGGVRKELRADGKKLLKPASIILTKSPLGLSAMLTRGWDHAAICVGHEANVVSIAEMTAKGFGIVSWNKICDHARRVLILECDDFDDEYRAKVVEKCLSFAGRSYDYQFEAGDENLDCVELPISSDFDGRISLNPLLVRMTGTKTFWPQQLLDAPNMSVAWDSDGILKGKVKA